MNEVEAIIKHWNEGLTATQIGAKIGKTRAAVLGKISRLRASGVDIDRRVVMKEDNCKKPKDRPVVIRKRKKYQEHICLDLFSILPEPQEVIGIDLFSLKSYQCHYVIGRFDDTSMYCGEPVHRRSMCRDHYRRCYVVVK